MSNYAERDAERAQRDDAVRRRMFRHQRRKAAESYALAASKVTMSDLDIMQDEILRSQVLVQSLRGLPTPVMDRSSQDTHTALRSLQVSRRTIEALREAQKLTEPDTLVVEGAARVSAQTLKDAIQNRLVASVDAQNVVRAPHAAREAQRVMDKADEVYCASQQALEDCTRTRQPIARAQKAMEQATKAFDAARAVLLIAEQHQEVGQADKTVGVLMKAISAESTARHADTIRQHALQMQQTLRMNQEQQIQGWLAKAHAAVQEAKAAARAAQLQQPSSDRRILSCHTTTTDRR